MEKDIYTAIMENPFGLSALDQLNTMEQMKFEAGNRKQLRLDAANKAIYTASNNIELLILVNKLDSIYNTNLNYISDSNVNTFNQSIDKFLKANS